MLEEQPPPIETIITFKDFVLLNKVKIKTMHNQYFSNKQIYKPKILNLTLPIIQHR